MKMSMVAGAVAALLSLSSVAPDALAQTAPPTLGSVKAGTYKVDSYHTEVEFSLSHFGFTNYAGFLAGVTGSLELDPTHLTATKLDVTIPVQSIMTTVPKLTDELKGAQWFDTAQFPSATFTSTKVVSSSNGEATITGNLTLHGVTKPVVLHAHLIGAGVNPIDKAYTVGFEATTTIKRSEFGVSTYVPAIGDDVQLTIEGAFELQG
jgi:polyisoprenoid-binding protein YceI